VDLTVKIYGTSQKPRFGAAENGGLELGVAQRKGRNKKNLAPLDLSFTLISLR
jgi:hypothetical protein